VKYISSFKQQPKYGRFIFEVSKSHTQLDTNPDGRTTLED